MQILRDHRKRQAGERLKVGPEWRGTHDYVFSTAWGEPIHPDTVSSLMTTLVNTTTISRASRYLMPGCTIFATYMPRPCCWLASPVHVVAARLGRA